MLRIISRPDGSLGLNAYFITFDLFSFYRILAKYMVWHLIKPLIGELSKPFRDASLELLKVEKGVESGAPPWKSCVTKTNSVMGFATGYLYINERAGKNAKQQVRTWKTLLKTFIHKLEMNFFSIEKVFHVTNVVGIQRLIGVIWQSSDDRLSLWLTVFLLFVLCQAEEMIAGIKDAFKTNLPQVKWMDEETKTKALNKV